ncbi:MAG: adenosine deaminase [Theionarchaea archaeon]|nr:adenosine deaminase [Theionarchaea archaeon]MBU7000579.1 adenosine deaminase [Theionarchaea archaeon]MBU7020481.1 adenosine deaminase [Theionarchaea archaeon]MBU7034477.1 adenosine deaminase [Theionarchaea archaeon]MBU7039774.1 adenosine deaminase [Theionarchaea archaeon]
MNPSITLEQLTVALPKVELHLHLEGAIPLETLFQLVQKKGDPSIESIDDLQRKLTYTDFDHFIDTWIWKNAFITEEKDFEWITYDVLQSLAHHHVRYVEAFYSPSDYFGEGISTQKITEYVIKGKERAYRDYGIRCELIMDIVRGNSLDMCMQQVEDVEPYLGKGVIGIGLGGREQKYPADIYVPVYRKADRAGFRLTAHAGEAAGPESIWAAIKKLGCERIGHGVRAHEDPELVAFLSKTRLPLELCVISNVRTGVCPSLADHPIKQYFERGLLVTVSSDDPTMFNTTISREYEVLAENLGFSIEDLKRISFNSITASFLSERDKESLRSRFEREWNEVQDRFLTEH